MTITTKFNFGDRIWFLNKDQKAITGRVVRIHIEAKEQRLTYTYFVQTNADNEPYAVECLEQKFCHATKEELIESLTNY